MVGEVRGLRWLRSSVGSYGWEDPSVAMVEDIRRLQWLRTSVDCNSWGANVQLQPLDRGTGPRPVLRCSKRDRMLSAVICANQTTTITILILYLLLSYTLVTATPPPPTNFKIIKRCLGLEVPHRALVVAARMLQHALSIQDDKGERRQPLPAAAATASVIVELTNAGKPAGAGLAATGGGSSVGDDRRKKKEIGDPPPPVSREEFGRIVALCLLPYSLTWTDAIYGVCLGEGGVEGEERTLTSNGDSGKAKKGNTSKVCFVGGASMYVGVPGYNVPGYNLPMGIA